MDIDFHVMSAEDINFSDNSFDVITVCQCFWYFDHETVMPKFYHMHGTPVESACQMKI